MQQIKSTSLDYFRLYEAPDQKAYYLTVKKGVKMLFLLICFYCKYNLRTVSVTLIVLKKMKFLCLLIAYGISFNLLNGLLQQCNSIFLGNRHLFSLEQE